MITDTVVFVCLSSVVIFYFQIIRHYRYVIVLLIDHQLLPVPWFRSSSWIIKQWVSSKINLFFLLPLLLYMYMFFYRMLYFLRKNTQVCSRHSLIVKSVTTSELFKPYIFPLSVIVATDRIWLVTADVFVVHRSRRECKLLFKFSSPIRPTCSSWSSHRHQIYWRAR